MTHVRIEMQVRKLEQKLARAEAARVSEERHAQGCLELVAKMAKETGAVATNAIEIAKRAASAELQAGELEHQLMLRTAERDGFRARAEKADEHAFHERLRVHELLHNLPGEIGIQTHEVESAEAWLRSTRSAIVDKDVLSTVNEWLSAMRRELE